MDFTEKKLPRNPFLKANPISKLFFLWVLPLFRKGYKQDLKYEDLYRVVDKDQAVDLGDQLELAWLTELKNAKKSGKKPRLAKALAKLFMRDFLIGTAFYSLDSWVIQVSQPIFLRLLIQSISNDEDNSNAYFYAAAICIATFAHAIVLHPCVFSLFHLGMRCRVASSGLIYRKALRLTKAAQGEATVGKLVNLLSNDVNRFDTNINFLPFMATGPVQFLIFVYFLWDTIGPSCLAAIGIIVLFLPLQYFAGSFSAKYRLSIAKRTDERGRIMNEIIVGMRVIKMYTWEQPFSLLIDGIRKLEVSELRKRGILRGVHLCMINAAPKFIAFATFVTYVLAGNQMSSETVFFTSTSLYTVAQIMVHFMPQAAAGLGELIVAVNRIEEFLLLEEQHEGNIIRPIKDASNNPGIVFENVTASWTKEKITLDDISVNIKGDKLLMVVGQVGSGKTSFLQTLTAELPVSSGKLSVTGSYTYGSQEPWIFSGNLRQNILFGQPFDTKRYFETIRVCALEQDLAQLPFADMTVVGERGVALSGGQKARVNLARALYRKSDIYLMDDPLSAVDTKVSRQLFESIQGRHLEGSLRILVTHQLQYLSQADHIIVLDQGKVLAQGTYDQLVAQGIDFVSLMTSEGADDKATRKNSILQPEEKSNEKKSNDSKSENQNEKMAVGSVTLKTYSDYFKTGNSPVGLFFLVTGFVLAQVLASTNDFWLSFWANAEDRRNDISSNKTGCIDSEIYPGDQDCEDTYLGRDSYLLIYTGFNLSSVILNAFRCLYFYVFCTKISKHLHDRMFRSLVRAPTKFFDDNPSGRVMNRFTKDIGAIDEMLPPAFADTATIFLNMIGVITLVIISNYFLSVPTVFLFLALYVIRGYFVRTSRDLKRIESLTRSPLFTHVAATMQGITTIRASNSQNILRTQFDGHQDMHSSVWYLFMATTRWFGIWLEIISGTFLAFVSFSFLTIASSSDGGNVGLAISSVLTLMGSFQWGMRQSAETENYMTSVERAFEYTRLTPEAPLESDSNKKPPKDWPNGGEIRFQQVSLAYDEEPVLRNLTFDIRAKNKIGIVGRTGAGKSSIIAALFRMTEPSGDIFIDGIRINDIGLHDLRKNISIIPQDPVLFCGTMRYNLDPFKQFEDNELWKVIEEVELKDAVPSLDFRVADSGSNFSVGERQLVCLARAILRRNKIIVMDEATANVDPRTDALIQKTIRSKFADCTILTIAHRLNSVIDCDKILVLDHGNLMEYDHPYTLVQKSGGIFSSMVAQTGRRSETMLRKMAEEAFSGKRASFNSTNSIQPSPDVE